MVDSEHLTLTEALSTQKGGNIEITDGVDLNTTVKEDWHERKVGYFCVGTGGINIPSPLVLAKPHNYETRLYNMIPFRCVPVSEGDLPAAERSKYRLRCRETINGVEYYTYYLKKFTPIDDKVSMTKSNGHEYTPVYNDSEPVSPSSPDDHPLAGDSIFTYVSLELMIEDIDVKEYMRAINSENSLVGAFISEFGLVIANEKTVNDEQEVFNSELFSKVVHPPVYMDQEANDHRISYEILS